MAATVLVHLRVQKIAHTQKFVGTERVSERKTLQQMTAEWSRETEFPKFSLYPYQFTVQLAKLLRYGTCVQYGVHLFRCKLGLIWVVGPQHIRSLVSISPQLASETH